jgi:hypothetical protein
MMISNKLKLFTLLLLILCLKVNAQKKNANDVFENKALARKVNNVLSFIDISQTINLNDYNKSVIYAIVSPIHENYFAVSLNNKLPVEAEKQCKCFKLEDNRFLIFIDKSDENYGNTDLYKKHFGIIKKNVISCGDLFAQLKNNKLPKIPENVLAYSIFEETFVYLEDLATFDALQYLEIEYNLNKFN